MLSRQFQFLDLCSGFIEMTAIERLKANSDRAKVNAWLDHIQEFDAECRAEVLAQCETDKEARAYYVGRYEEDCK